ncbi:MAG TPA: cation transporter [Chlorobaculum sp.]|uniref:Cation efflux family protein n=1 Tax=Chlorobaculum tepidum (strain ATCC 49652 / DSM 12025 / NBRC 103806 / TLS) TaxID=194439 RepID=Q8KEZ4_CHLTE|nr:cation diffusion facilitator family transporter [Chlorobaculum tepidum]AAM71780.1 cation efflux family protein [Chlorobaculum tepidum TLS]HBU24018.1 cation transporter [Chlorobaculum sp.]
MSNHEEKKQHVALSSVAASLLLTAMKLVVGLMTGSIGILSEAAHSAIDFGAAALTWFAVRISDKPADKKHHYGHTKIESVSALIETGLLILTSVWIIYEAVTRLLSGTTEIEVTWYAIAVIIISIIVDISRASALKKVAKETKSQALEADALHFTSDIVSSAVVLAGLGFVALGMHWADAVAGIFVAVLVGKAAWELGRKTIDVLIDTAPEGLSEQIEEIVVNAPGVIGINKMRIKPAGGPFVFIDLTISVSRTLPQEKVVAICAGVEQRLKAALPDSDITVNARPVVLDSETVTERIHTIGLNHGLHAHNILTSLSGDHKQITFDVEVDSRLTIRQAHDAVTELENELHREFNEEIDLCIHLDPINSEERNVQPADPENEARITALIRQAASTIPGILNVHALKIHVLSYNKLCITLHCGFDDNTVLADVHPLTSRLECLIYRDIPETSRIIVHAEPVNAGD